MAIEADTGVVEVGEADIEVDLLIHGALVGGNECSLLESCIDRVEESI